MQVLKTDRNGEQYIKYTRERLPRKVKKSYKKATKSRDNIDRNLYPHDFDGNLTEAAAEMLLHLKEKGIWHIK